MDVKIFQVSLNDIYNTTRGYLANFSYYYFSPRSGTDLIFPCFFIFEFTLSHTFTFSLQNLKLPQFTLLFCRGLRTNQPHCILYAHFRFASNIGVCGVMQLFGYIDIVMIMECE